MPFGLKSGSRGVRNIHYDHFKYIYCQIAAKLSNYRLEVGIFVYLDILIRNSPIILQTLINLHHTPILMNEINGRNGMEGSIMPSPLSWEAFSVSSWVYLPAQAAS